MYEIMASATHTSHLLLPYHPDIHPAGSIHTTVKGWVAS